MSDTVAPQEGKFYRTRSGERVGPFEVDGSVGHCALANGRNWHVTGKFNNYYPDDVDERQHDLIAEWTEGPVVTEMVKRIVPGVYGCIQAGEPTNGDICVSFVGKIYYSANDLRAAAATLTALADAL